MLRKKKPKRRETRIRYEREHSMSLRYTDWFYYNARIIAYLDDASRLIVGYGVFDNATSENAIKVSEGSHRKLWQA